MNKHTRKLTTEIKALCCDLLEQTARFDRHDAADAYKLAEDIAKELESNVSGLTQAMALDYNAQALWREQSREHHRACMKLERMQ